MRIVLDTCALFNPGIWDQLSERHEDIILPAVAFAERARQIHLNGGSVREFEIILSAFQIAVEPFSRSEALRHAPAMEDETWWRTNARDAFIAGHVRPGDELWTGNTRDFLKLGIPQDSLVSF